MSSIPQKRCSKCETEKPLTDFGKKASASDRLQSQCKSCIAVYSMNNTERGRERVRTWRNQNIERANENDRRKRQRYRDQHAGTQRPTIGTKRCSRCGGEKLVTAFYVSNSKSTGLSSWCGECQYMYHNEWRARNRLALRGKQRIYRQMHRSHLLVLARNYRRVNAEQVRAYRRKWQRSHPEQRREMVLRRRARIRQNRVERVDYAVIWQRDQGICHICGGVVESNDVHYDHVIALANGGAHSMDNIKVSHSICNMRKGAR